MNLPRIGVLVSVRTNSKRLPAKAFLPINGKPSILFLLDRLGGGLEFPLYIATSTHWTDDYLTELLKKHGYSVFRGDEENVFARLLSLAQNLALDYIVRITADCPLLDSTLVNDLIKDAFEHQGWILATTKSVHPPGIDLEIVSVSEMGRAFHKLTQNDKEHVTSFFYRQAERGKILTLQHPNLKVSTGSYLLDTLEDFIFLNQFIDGQGGNFTCTKNQ